MTYIFISTSLSVGAIFVTERCVIVVGISHHWHLLLSVIVIIVVVIVVVHTKLQNSTELRAQNTEHRTLQNYPLNRLDCTF